MSTEASKAAAAPATVPIPFGLNMFISGICGCGAWGFCHPFELIKNKTINAIVDGGPTPKFFPTAKAIMNSPGGLYKGFDAGLARQASYTSFRIGFYDPIKDLLCGDRKPTMVDRAIAGAVAGSAASFFSSPVEVSLVCQSKAKEKMSLPQAMTMVYNKSGLGGFWRGCVPLMSRAAIVGVCQVGFYDQCLTWVKAGLPHLDFKMQSILAGTATGIFYAAVTMPVEVSRVLLSAQQGDLKNAKYRNMPQTIMTVTKESGFLSMYRAYIPYMGRCTMHSIVCFLLIDICKDFLKTKGYRG